jgi:hypothetical protein
MLEKKDDAANGTAYPIACLNHRNFTSDMPSIADVVRTFPHVRVVPISDIAPGRLRLNFARA